MKCMIYYEYPMRGDLGSQGSEGFLFTHGSSAARSQEDAYIIHSYETEPQHMTGPPVHQPHLLPEDLDLYHVPRPERDYINQPEHTTSPIYQPHLKPIVGEHTFSEGWNDCRITIQGDEGLQIVANGQVYIEKETEVITVHGRSLPNGYRRVSIKDDIVPTAPFPCPNDELVVVFR